MGEGGGVPAGGAVLAPVRLDPQDRDPLMERILPPLASGVHWGLERVRAFLDETGCPERRFVSVLIGGTNGKGSVASLVASVLARDGRRTGLYTSPHLCSFRERFRIAGRPVDERALTALADEYREALVRHGLTFFEAATVLAFHLFAREGVEVASVEVGLGGRLDATNVLEPVVTAVTNVAMDHADYLGDTLEAIAGEKAGIARAGVPFLTAETDPALRRVFARACEAVGARLEVVQPPAERVEVAEDHTAFVLASTHWGPLDLRTPLPGLHQAANAALAVRVLERLPEGLRPSREAIVAGIAGVRWPGRVQVVHRDGETWLFDVAHNTAGALALAATLERLPLPEPRVVLAGVLGDKDWARMLPPVFEGAHAAVLTQPPSAPAERRWDPHRVARIVGDACPIHIVEDFDAALAEARRRALGGTLVVTGSNHTVGDALARLDVPAF
ncbi:MAG: bifunctional folylpolyglutamate synthase/dihydrofolate synthase [Gemmatimonadetes bacterium]|nr:MAG: bifunctional folylpolyglutamate synthase/dihydrofolate synthase [Gemmatimonadota bacterium]